MRNLFHRRGFLGTTAAAAGSGFLVRTATAAEDRPALLGGKPVREGAFPGWPVVERREEDALLGVLRSGRWYRGNGKKVGEFEAAYADWIGVPHCVATANGTGALVAALGAIGVEAGDEVIVPPYTFIATVNAVLMHHALPVFVDTDIDTFQVDARKVESAITDRTAAILPVHLGGGVADLDTLLEVGTRRKLPVVEDACQSHLAEWRGRRVGSLGTAGCFSFQVTKNLPSGEGGAITTRDALLAEKCYAFHNNGRPRNAGASNVAYLGGRGANLRLTEFQGALLLAQMARTEAQSRRREENAAALTAMLEEVPGITPAATYPGCTRNAYHLYMFRYDPEAFAGLPRARFMEALAAEGVPCSGGYGPLNKESFLDAALASRGFRRLFPEKTLAEWRERNACPANDRLCAQAVWFTQTMLLGPRSDMDQIAAAVRKVHAHAAALARA
jgi:dTDP-4-amino-4,6-dideoxygalactose transaminase